jgi:hypothetical protein
MPGARACSSARQEGDYGCFRVLRSELLEKERAVLLSLRGPTSAAPAANRVRPPERDLANDIPPLPYVAAESLHFLGSVISAVTVEKATTPVPGPGLSSALLKETEPWMPSKRPDPLTKAPRPSQLSDSSGWCLQTAVHS